MELHPHNMKWEWPLLTYVMKSSHPLRTRKSPFNNFSWCSFPSGLLVRLRLALLPVITNSALTSAPVTLQAHQFLQFTTFIAMFVSLSGPPEILLFHLFLLSGLFQGVYIWTRFFHMKVALLAAYCLLLLSFGLLFDPHNGGSNVSKLTMEYPESS